MNIIYSKYIYNIFSKIPAYFCPCSGLFFTAGWYSIVNENNLLTLHCWTLVLFPSLPLCMMLLWTLLYMSPNKYVQDFLFTEYPGIGYRNVQIYTIMLNCFLKTHSNLYFHLSVQEFFLLHNLANTCYWRS